ncbi:hypothetical protein E2M60_05225 [Salmonella enterica subsp. enterica serovar Newport]|nr:hypothetical protein [Salmonella enterica subsp. enterica serovar Newport]
MIFRSQSGDMVKIFRPDVYGLCLLTKCLEDNQFIWSAVHADKNSIATSQPFIFHLPR